MKKLKFLTLAIIAALSVAVPLQAVVTNLATQTTTAMGTGSTTDYTIGFDFRDNSQLVVTKYDTSVPSTTVVAQGAGASKYTVLGGNPGTTVRMGTAPTTTQYLIISRSIPLTQPVAFDPAQAFPISALGVELDQMTLQMQNLAASVGGAVNSGGGGGGGSSGTLPTGWPNNFIGFDSLGVSTVTIPGSTVTLVANDILRFNGSKWINYNLTGASMIAAINGQTTTLSPGAGGTGVSNTSGSLTFAKNLTFTSAADAVITFPGTGTVLEGTAATGNSPNTFVTRDGSGNFSAGAITASIIGNVTGNLTGNVTGNTSGTAANVTGTIAIGNGGTGQTTQAAAITALTGTQVSGQFLRSNGTNAVMSALLIGDVPQGFSRLKLAQGTASTVVLNDASGNLFDLPPGALNNVLVSNGTTWVAGVENNIANSQFATMPNLRLKGNVSGGAAVPSDLTGTQATTILDAYIGDSGSGGLKGLVPAPATGDATKFLKGDGTWATVSGSGTVTSVALTAPAIFSVAGSPVTSAGTLALTLANESANTIFAGPTSGGAVAPTFRAMVGADLPSFTGDVTNVAAAMTIANSAVTSAKMANMVAHTYKGNNTASTAAPADITNTQLTADLNLFSSTLQGLVPASGGGTTNFLRADGSWAVAGSGTVTSVAMSVPSFLSVAGSPVTTSGTLAVTLSGTALPIANGGTGQTTANAAFNALSPMTTLGDIEYEDATPKAVRLAGNTTSALNILTQTGTGTVSAAPAWASSLSGSFITGGTFGAVNGSALTALNGSNIASGIVGTSVGGTGLSSPTANSVLLTNGASALQTIAPGTSGNVLTSNGTTWASTALPAGGALVVSGTRASPTNITAVGGITSTSSARGLQFVQGNGGAVTITANPQISAGVTVGQEIVLVGRSATNTITFADGTGLSLNGPIILGADSVLSLFWDGTNWVETSRR